MDPNLQQPTSSVPQAPPPQSFKDSVRETSNDFVKDHYEGFLHKIIGIMFSIIKFVKNNLIIMIKMVLGKE